MNKKLVLESLKKLREINKKREFLQTADLVINLKSIDIKKPGQKVDLFIKLPYSKGKENKICALVDHELLDQAKKYFNKTVLKEEFIKYENKKVQKKFVREFDFFLAQANIMTNVASSFGKTLGPLGKMPNPKSECIVPPTANLEVISGRLRNMVHIQTKNDSVVRSPVGSENMNDEEISENILNVYNSVVRALPQEEANIRNVMIKFSMSNPIKITDKGPEAHAKVVEKKKSKYKDKKSGVKKEAKNERVGKVNK